MLGSVVSVEERSAVNDGINVITKFLMGDSLIRRYECMLCLVSA